MRFHTLSCALLITANGVVDGFTSPYAFVASSDRSTITTSLGADANRGVVVSSDSDAAVDESLFASLLREGGDGPATPIRSSSRRQQRTVVLPDGSAAHKVIMASDAAVAAPPSSATLDDYYAPGASEEEETASASASSLDDFLKTPTDDPAAAVLTPQEQAVRSFQNLQPKKMPQIKKFMGIRYTTGTGESLKELLDKKDYNSVILSYGVPLTLLGTVAVWSANKLAGRYGGQVDDLYTSYANEMVYHDGDFEEMQMCHDDYVRRLSVWTSFRLGRGTKRSMIGRFLETYAKKKPVSPQAISSLSYVLTMYKLSEETAAKILVKVAESSLMDKLASAGKLLFFGERILKSPGGQQALQPIRDMLIEKNGRGGKAILDTSLKAMAEAAYRNTVTDAGKDQESLTVGWEVLGLSRETAERIFEEAAENEFKSRRELQFGGSGKLNYDDKGRRINEDGSLVDPTKAEDDDDDGGDDASGGGGAGGANIYECSECGYTLFPAKGREFKFFPATFTCPECGAAKDKFVGR